MVVLRKVTKVKAMNIQQLHHVSLVTKDVDRSVRFYRDILGLQQIARPPFDTVGAWLEAGPVQIHLIANTGGTFRANRKIDTADGHFAIRVADFRAAMDTLAAKGFGEDLPDGDPKRIVVRRTNVAGYPQAYLLDPDGNIIEINAAA